MRIDSEGNSTCVNSATAQTTITGAQTAEAAARLAWVLLPWRQMHSFVTCDASGEVTCKWSGRKKTARIRQTLNQRGMLALFSRVSFVSITGSDNLALRSCQIGAWLIAHWGEPQALVIWRRTGRIIASFDTINEKWLARSLRSVRGRTVNLPGDRSSNVVRLRPLLKEEAAGYGSGNVCHGLAP
jgi:hypothetical protein